MVGNSFVVLSLEVNILLSISLKLKFYAMPPGNSEVFSTTAINNYYSI